MSSIASSPKTPSPIRPADGATNPAAERVINPRPRPIPSSTLLRRRVTYWWNRLKAVGWRRRFAEFGLGSRIGTSFRVHHAERIAIGADVAIWNNVRIEAVGGEDDEVVLRIGPGCVISSYSRIAAAWSVNLGTGVGLGQGVLITDHNHDFRDLTEPWLNRPALLAKPVEIADGAFVGDGCVILPGVTIGHHSVIGANSVVTKDVPPYHIAAGVPARLLSRFDPLTKTWHKL